MGKLFVAGLLSSLLGCGAAAAPPVEPIQGAPSANATTTPIVSKVVRTRLPKETAPADGDVSGFYLQIISPGSDAGELADRATKMISGHCSGTIIVYRDKRGVMGAGAVFATEAEKHACATSLERTDGTDDYPSSAVWRKAD